ncbi:MAG: aminoacyl-histidine dipeptidase [Phycisphaerae bacterium]|nr:aminoacyl-histidine dipeptidase [Phycisphaerae bacterium]
MQLTESKARSVWQFFSKICSIPHPSDHEQQIIQWLIDYAEGKKLTCNKDKAGNVIIKVPATAGCEKWPTVILQGHVDMVCEKTPQSNHDFMKDPIRMVEQDGWIYGDQTTLGADNGIGCAMALAMTKADDKLVHGPLELLFTVSEETGLNGADGLDATLLSGKYLINIDSEDDSEFVIGCAGGQQTAIELDLCCTAANSGWQSYLMTVSGCSGGHSGVNIHCQRANAIHILSKTLAKLQQHDIALTSIKGGSAHNAIPRDAEALLCFSPAVLPEVQQTIKQCETLLKGQYAKTDANLSLKIEAVPQKTSRIMDPNSFAATVNLLNALPHGVFRYNQEIHGLPEASNNLATLATDMENCKLKVSTSQRSSLEASLDELTDKIVAAATLVGAKWTNNTRYAAWQPDFESKLVSKAKGLYHSIHTVEPHILIIHAGLECGVIGKKMPGLEMLSMGPNIENPHSPQERVNIASVDRSWQFLKLLLSELKE